jgi:hypothetical protein
MSNQALLKVQPIKSDGFDERFEEAMGRGIKRWRFDAKTESKYFVDGVVLPKDTYVAVNCYEEQLHWRDKKIIEPRRIRRPGEPWQSAAERNNALPKTEWVMSEFTGALEGPIKDNFAIELLNLRDGAKYIFSNSTWGHQICFFDLQERVRSMRLLRGEQVYAIVSPSTAPMKTRFGVTLRPHLEIVGWRTFGQTPAVITAPLQGEPVAELSSAEIIGDDLPPWDDGISDIVK